jgi:proline dehydrogenase
MASTLGYWDGPDDTPEGVADSYISGIEALGQSGLDGYLSIKFPAIRSSSELLATVFEAAKSHGIRVHFDAMAPEDTDPAWSAISEVAAGFGPVGCTLPGRWQRSLDDAEFAIDAGLTIRVVKGQWADPVHDDPDLRAGYLRVIDRLAGRARFVAVATHDVPLAHEAIRRLQASCTPCGCELLYGLPSQASLRLARQLGVDVRVYVPYGQAYLPYCLSKALRSPRTLWWLLKDMVIPKRDTAFGPLHSGDGRPETRSLTSAGYIEKSE